ncbi:MAG TPA: hypothetical protein VII06_34155 [Chloroflexota bacterium]|jgi:hypothetical protein
MTTSPNQSLPALSRRQVAAEVLELGEALFDAAIDAATGGQPAQETDEPYPEAELRAAADEFFTALRLLLRLEQGENATAAGELTAPLIRAAPEGDEGRA